MLKINNTYGRGPSRVHRTGQCPVEVVNQVRVEVQVPRIIKDTADHKLCWSVSIIEITSTLPVQMECHRTW
jgi:hypothetical protein